MSVGSLPIVEGLNLWRIAVRGDTGHTRKQILGAMRSVGWQLLSAWQGTDHWPYHYGKAHTHWAWGIGSARPFEALDCTREPPALEAQGEVLGAFSGDVASPDWLGPAPLWYVEAWVYWRGAPQESRVWPTAYEPDWLGNPSSSLLYPPFATIEVAVGPRAKHAAEDKSYGDTWRERIEREVTQTVEDLPQIPTPSQSPVPYLILGAGVVVFAGVLAAKIGD